MLNTKEITTALHQIAPLWDIDPNSIQFLRRGMNYAYQATRKNGQAIIIRVSEDIYRTADLIRAELDWIDFLNRHINHKKLIVTQPIATLDQQTIVTLNLQNHSYYIVCWHKFTGEMIDIKNPKLYTEENLFHYGAAMALLHKTSEAYTPTSTQRPDWVTYRNSLPRKSIPHDISKMMDEHYAKINQYEKNNSNYGMTHGDFKFDNILLKDKTLQVFDFDNCCYCWYVAEFILPLMVLFCWPDHGFYPAKKTDIDFFLKNTLAGYRSCRTLETTEFAKIPDLITGFQMQAFLDLNHFPNLQDYDANSLLDFIAAKFREHKKFLDYDFSSL